MQHDKALYKFPFTLLYLTLVLLQQMSEVHPFRFRLITVDRVYRFATDTSGLTLLHVLSFLNHLKHSPLQK